VFAWDDLKHLLEFARKGSILAAAKAQGVNQSTVQRRLIELQKALGQQLLERDVTGYRLSQLGQDLLPYAQRIEAAVQDFERQLASHDDCLTGVVRVTCAPTVGDRLRRAQLIDAFERRFPGMRVELLLSDGFADLSKREADIAIRSQGWKIDDETLVGRKIAEGNWAVYASRSYVARHGKPQNPEEIVRHHVVKCDGHIRDHQATRWLRQKAPDALVAASVENWAGLLLAVKSGAALAPLPIAVGDTESELVRVIDNIPELTSHFYLLMHRDMKGAPRVRAFFDFVISEIKVFRAALAGKPEGADFKQG
jgi:DNA-binding transcriptional LysR family regulator